MDAEPRKAPAFDPLGVTQFLPRNLGAHPEREQQLRLFLLSHLLGPFIGLVLGGFLFFAGGLDAVTVTITAGVMAFWLYVPAVRSAERFTPLAFLSLQHLTRLVLFASYHYGGFASPFFLWLLVVPLFGFFYLSDAPTLRAGVVLSLLANLAAYVAVTEWIGLPRERALPGGDAIYLLSLSGACLYVMFMAQSHARLLKRQTALEKQSELQRQIAQEMLLAKEAAEAASRSKTEFLATTSHELRTPLNAIIGFSQLIRQQPYGAVGDKYLGYVKDIEDSGTHLLGIINDILDIARAESGRFELNEDAVDLADGIERALRQLEARAQKAGLAMTAVVPADLPLLWADGRRLKQMLLNLIGNAIKFTPHGGSITVAAHCDRDGMRLTVTDTGIGISEAELERVTAPFYQVDNSLARSNEGAGLGLSVVSHIIARHGGRLVLTSTVGKGTQAMLVFPLSRVRIRQRNPAIATG